MRRRASRGRNAGRRDLYRRGSRASGGRGQRSARKLNRRGRLAQRRGSDGRGGRARRGDGHTGGARRHTASDAGNWAGAYGGHRGRQFLGLGHACSGARAQRDSHRFLLQRDGRRLGRWRGRWSWLCFIVTHGRKFKNYSASALQALYFLFNEFPPGASIPFSPV